MHPVGPDRHNYALISSEQQYPPRPITVKRHPSPPLPTERVTMASSSSGVRLWRTAFLTLRDETLASPPSSSLHSLVRELILSQNPGDLVAAAAELPSHEVTLDVVLLAELALEVSECGDAEESLSQICHLIHDISSKVRLEVNSAYWTIMLNFVRKMVERTFGNAISASLRPGSTSKLKVVAEILEIIRLSDKAYKRNSSVSESMQLAEFLLCVVACLHSELVNLYPSYGNQRSDEDIGYRKPKSSNLWEMQTTAFYMIGDALCRIGPSISENLWLSLVETMRKVMDFLSSKNLLIVDNIMSRFFTTLLHCLHLLLTDPKGSLSGQVTGFGATLQMFFVYGLSSRSPQLSIPTNLKEKADGSLNQKPLLIDSTKSASYIPPHLRRGWANGHHQDAQSSSNNNSSQYGFSSSDSDLSDNDGYAMSRDQYRSSKARVAAIVCIQDLCHAEPKSLTSLWTLLLPENDVLQPRKYQATLMTCLLFDPVMKVRVASASALASMLDGHSSTFLQVAEHKGPIKCGSFTTLSSSLGQILVQLHTGIVHLIQHETHTELLASLFKILLLLISATPYARMPEILLPSLIASLCTRIRKDLASKVEYASHLGTALTCLGATLSVSPPSSLVLKWLEEDISRGLVHGQRESSIVSQLIHLSEQSRHPTVGFDALQVLRAVSHNYPGVVTLFWESISAVVDKLLKKPIHDDSSYEQNSGSWKGETNRTVGATSERCTVAAVKALDGCLRAASGFRGADDLIDCKLLDVQLTADYNRTKKVSSAPSYELEDASSSCLADSSAGIKQWCEVMEKHLPVALSHRCPMVRAAAVTCFAGITSSVFFSLSKEKRELVISYVITSALNDGVPSVRSAACRAIGIIICFPEIIGSATVLSEFIRAVEFNSRDSLASVRITACWALANICDSLRCKETDLLLEKSEGSVCEAKSISCIIESALRLTKDGDKIKSNAVRALGNLSRFINFSCYSTTNNGASGSSDSCHTTVNGSKLPFANVSESSSLPCTTNGSKSSLCLESNWLERMVQAFVSCVTTGNVKVQWNVCHALSNLFMNDTLKLHNMSWAPAVYSILLLLLRDSTNYKIRIHAAVALSVPASRLDYGNSFSDVIQGLVHVIDSLNSVQSLTPSTFKYKDNLEKQLILTTLHVLGFASSHDDQALKDFLIKKSSFLEEWLKSACSSFIECYDPSSTRDTEPVENKHQGTVVSCVPKKAIVSRLTRAIKSLIDIYEFGNYRSLVGRFEKLASTFS